MWRHLTRALRAAVEALGGPAARDQTSRSERLILFFNSMWDQPLEPGPEPLPDGFRMTTDLRRISDAAAVVFHIPSLAGMPGQPKAPGQLWVAWSKECDVNYPQLRDPSYMRQFDLTMTYRLDADVAIPYTTYYGDNATFERALRRPARPKTPEKLAALVISSPFNRSRRLEYAAELMRHLDVHSYGKALRNSQLVADRGRATKLALIAGYKFTLAFENAVGEDYVTEKFFDPLIAGSVPVYLGAANVEYFAPGDRCFINTADFRGPKELAEYLLDLQRQDSDYHAYFAWKERPFRPSFMSLLAGQETPRDIRLCCAIQARLGEGRERSGVVSFSRQVAARERRPAADVSAKLASTSGDTM